MRSQNINIVSVQRGRSMEFRRVPWQLVFRRLFFGGIVAWRWAIAPASQCYKKALETLYVQA